ncbi:MAG TPA: hypothetical protein VG939_01910 [Caulobacteraceae bacterium]|nr:hypothetical protein [Caulobacteraceae bacterium]
MTPSLPEILRGQAVALSTPMPPEATGDYMAGRFGMLASLAILASQEAERGPAARVWENNALRQLFGRVAGAYDARLDGRLSAAAATADTEFTWSALDAANADLRRVLIALHEAVEAANDAALDREILALYRDMAHERRLELGM